MILKMTASRTRYIPEIQGSSIFSFNNDTHIEGKPARLGVCQEPVSAPRYHLCVNSGANERPASDRDDGALSKRNRSDVDAWRSLDSHIKGVFGREGSLRHIVLEVFGFGRWELGDI
jgi:hypothetical protein